MSNVTKAEVSFPFLGILALIFISLKLAGVGVVATWSWWAVLSPLWVPWVVVLFFILVAIIVGFFVRKI